MVQPPPVTEIPRPRRRWWLVVLAVAGVAVLLTMLASNLRPANVARVAHKNEALQAAGHQAQAELPKFIEALKHPTEGQSFFVRGSFKTGGGPEYLWVKHVTFDGKEFHGDLAEGPMLYREAKKGEAVSVKREDVYDWAIKDGQNIQGAFTSRVIDAG